MQYYIDPGDPIYLMLLLHIVEHYDYNVNQTEAVIIQTAVFVIWDVLLVL